MLGASCASAAMKQDKRRITLLAWLFVAPWLVGLLGLGLAFAGLIARHYEASAHLGIWLSIIGWSMVVLSIPLRWWAKRWSRRLRE